MSTLDITCGRCAKSFRVRAEFAGRATRCPGCSAPLTIGGSARPAAPREEEPGPRPRPRPRDDDDRPAKPLGNWKPVDTALGREQAALVCLLIQVACGLLGVCLAAAGGPGGFLNSYLVIPVAILLGGPALAAVVFGVSARVSATGAPDDSLARGAARASLVSAVVCLGCLAFFTLAALMRIDSNQRDELPLVVASAGVVASALAAVGSFAGFVAQVGIARRSAAVSRKVGALAIAATVCAAMLVGVGGLYTVANEAFAPPPTYHARGFNPGPDHSDFYRFAVFGLGPIGLGVMLVLYHRLLAAARRSIRGDRDG